VLIEKSDQHIVTPEQRLRQIHIDIAMPALMASMTAAMPHLHRPHNNRNNGYAFWLLMS